MEKDSTPIQMPVLVKKSKSFNAWLRVGYELFAQDGPEGIQIERLARILDLNKSGFYHYFGNHDTYFQHLMSYHKHQAELLVAQIQTTETFMTGSIQYLSDFSTSVLVQKQLQRARHLALFAKTYAEVNNMIDTVTLPLWTDFIEMPDNPPLALLYLEFVRDAFYSRVTPDTLSSEFIFELCMQAKEISQGLKNSYSGMVVPQ